MKDFYTLSMNELINLDSDAFEDYVDAEILKKGIGIQSGPDEVKPSRYVAPDLMLINFNDLTVDRKVGEEIIALLNKYGYYRKDWNTSYHKHCTEMDGYNSPRITTNAARSEINSKEEEIATAPTAAAREHAKVQREAYDAYLVSRKEVADNLKVRITEAWQSYYDTKSTLTAYEKALKVADNDEALAKKIFVGYGGSLDALNNALAQQIAA